MQFINASTKRSPVGRSVIGSDHLAVYDDEKYGKKVVWGFSRARDDGATMPAEQQCLLWTQYPPAYPEVNHAMQELIVVNCDNEEQNKDNEQSQANP